MRNRLKYVYLYCFIMVFISLVTGCASFGKKTELLPTSGDGWSKLSGYLDTWEYECTNYKYQVRGAFVRGTQYTYGPCLLAILPIYMHLNPKVKHLVIEFRVKGEPRNLGLELSNIILISKPDEREIYPIDYEKMIYSDVSVLYRYHFDIPLDNVESFSIRYRNFDDTCHPNDLSYSIKDSYYYMIDSLPTDY